MQGWTAQLFGVIHEQSRTKDIPFWPPVALRVSIRNNAEKTNHNTVDRNNGFRKFRYLWLLEVECKEQL